MVRALVGLRWALHSSGPARKKGDFSAVVRCPGIPAVMSPVEVRF